MKHVYLLLAAIAVVLSAMLCAGCRSDGEGFAIYLTAQDVPVERMEMLSHVDLADEPVISEDDILSYRRDTHEMVLTDAACQRLSQIQVPVSGIPFLVCVDRAPVYWGAFWPLYSSLSFDGVVVSVPLTGDDTIVRIDTGYPGPSFFTGEDPRSDPHVLQALQKAGKLDAAP